MRFPEFEDEWIEKRFDEIASDFSYGMNSAAIEFDGNNKYIRITDIDENTREFVPNPLTSPDGTIEDKYKLSKGDIVFARTGATVGKSYLYNENDGNLYYAGFLIKANVDRANESFVFFNTLRSNYNKWVKIMSMRSGQPGINAEEYRSLKLKIPSLSEQNKIAKLLTVIDGRISTQNKIIEDYKLLKNGMMQKIFKQKLCFKDEKGNAFPEWEDKKMSEIATFFSGGTPKSTNSNYYSGNIPFIGSGDISKEKVDSYITYEAFDSSSAKMVEVGDILYALYGATSGEVSLSKMEGAINQAVLCIKTMQNKYFIAELLKFNKENIVGKYLQGGQGNLSAQIVKDLKFLIPSIPEQYKIASTLSTIDKKVELEKSYLDNLKVQKRYLLQNLFI